MTVSATLSGLEARVGLAVGNGDVSEDTVRTVSLEKNRLFLQHLLLGFYTIVGNTKCNNYTRLLKAELTRTSKERWVLYHTQDADAIRLAWAIKMKECATSSQAMRTGVKERTRSMIRPGVIDTSVKRKTVIKEIARERRSMVGKGV